jgi:hypothetical protein
VHCPVGAESVAKYCAALSSNGPAFQHVLHDMLSLGVSVERGLQRVSDIVVACARQMPRSGGTRRAQNRRSRQGAAPWFDAECGAWCARFKAAWAAHVGSPLDAHLHGVALAARK